MAFGRNAEIALCQERWVLRKRRAAVKEHRCARLAMTDPE
jgi:hypothetical protein